MDVDLLDTHENKRDEPWCFLFIYHMHLRHAHTHTYDPQHHTITTATTIHIMIVISHIIIITITIIIIIVVIIMLSQWFCIMYTLCCCHYYQTLSAHTMISSTSRALSGVDAGKTKNTHITTIIHNKT